MSNKLTLKSAFFAVLATLVVSGVLCFNSNSAYATDVPAKVGETVTVTDGDTVVVEAPKTKPTAVAVKAAAVTDSAPATPKETTAPTVATPSAIMADNFSEPKAAAEDVVDQDSMVELAVRGVLHPSGPAIGATLGFSWRPANRVRIHAGFDASKGLLEVKGDEAELAQFGFTVAATRTMTRTVELGAFGTMSWAYRDLVKEVSASFVGAGPGFRINKAGGLIFFEAAIPIGLGKKFANSDWQFSHALSASFGFHF